MYLTKKYRFYQFMLSDVLYHTEQLYHFFLPKVFHFGTLFYIFSLDISQSIIFLAASAEITDRMITFLEQDFSYM